VTRVALVGLGAMGRNHLRVLSDLDGTELVAVCDQDAAVVDAVSRKHSIPGYTSLVEMLDRERLDAAIVVVPTRFHVDSGVTALEHGLHVLVEKPIASNLEEGRRLIAAAASAHRIFSVGHIERSTPGGRGAAAPDRRGGDRKEFISCRPGGKDLFPPASAMWASSLT